MRMTLYDFKQEYNLTYKELAEICRDNEAAMKKRALSYDWDAEYNPKLKQLRLYGNIGPARVYDDITL